MSRTLYLVSSSANREYVVDCLEALALPRGMVHHFRYRQKYVDERLWDSLPKRPGNLPNRLVGLPIVVIYTFQEQSRGYWQPVVATASTGGYVPIRCGILVDAFQDGGVAHFYFSVDEYVKRKVGRRSPREAIDQRIRFKTSARRDAGRSYAHLGTNLRVGARRRDDALAFQDFVEYAYKPSEWRTRSLGSAPLDVTYDPIFFRVSGLFRQRDGRLVEMVPQLRQWPGYPLAEYILDPNETYHLGISTYLIARHPAELPGQGTAQLALKFDPTVFRALGATSFRISSPYDLEQWTLQACGPDERRTVITVACSHDVVTDRENFVRREVLSAEISLPVIVRSASSGNRDGKGSR